jgi:hypothetical protein
VATHGLGYPRTRNPLRRQATYRRQRLLQLVQPERVLLSQVRSLAALYCWRCYHTYDARKSEPGYPDLTLVRGDRLIFAELKTQRGRLSADQSAWLEDLRATCAEVYVWRPADLSVIASILRRR